MRIQRQSETFSWRVANSDVSPQEFYNRINSLLDNGRNLEAVAMWLNDDYKYDVGAQGQGDSRRGILNSLLRNLRQERNSSRWRARHNLSQQMDFSPEDWGEGGVNDSYRSPSESWYPIPREHEIDIDPTLTYFDDSDDGSSRLTYSDEPDELDEFNPEIEHIENVANPNAKLKSPWSKKIVDYTLRKNNPVPKEFDYYDESHDEDREDLYRDFDMRPDIYYINHDKNYGLYQINDSRRQMDKSPVGFLQYHIDPEKPTIHIDMINTHPQHRLKGVGAALVNALAEDYPGHLIAPGFTTEHGTGFTNYMRKYAPGADQRLDTSQWLPTPANEITDTQMKEWGVNKRRSPVFARLAAVNQDFVNNLDTEFHDWWKENGRKSLLAYPDLEYFVTNKTRVSPRGSLPPDIDADKYRRQMRNYRAVNNEISRRGPIGYWPNIENFLKEKYPAAYRDQPYGSEMAGPLLDYPDDVAWENRPAYETGPEAVAQHGYDPKEIAAGMLLLHNQSHPLRGDMSQKDQQRLVDIAQKRMQMQRQYEQRQLINAYRTAMPACSDYDYLKGNCAGWALSHQREYPHLRLGVDWEHVGKGHPEWEATMEDNHLDPDDPYDQDHVFRWPQHVFTHDDTHAYDASGAHPLDSFGEWDGLTLNHTPDDAKAIASRAGMYDRSGSHDAPPEVVRRVPPHTAHRTAAVNQDFVGGLKQQFNEWRKKQPKGSIFGGGMIGGLDHWPNIEKFLEEEYPAAHRNLNYGLEQAGLLMDDNVPISNIEGANSDYPEWNPRANFERYETGPEAVANYGYDPKEIAAGFLLLHNKTDRFRGDLSQQDMERLNGIAQKRYQMQRDYEQRQLIKAHRTAMPTYYHRSPKYLQGQRPDRSMPHMYFYTADDPYGADWETRAYGDQLYSAELPAEVMEPDPAPRRIQDSPVRWWRTDPANVNVGEMTHLHDPTAPFGYPRARRTSNLIQLADNIIRFAGNDDEDGNTWNTLSDSSRVSTIDHFVERAGLGGKEFHIPTATFSTAEKAGHFETMPDGSMRPDPRAHQRVLSGDAEKYVNDILKNRGWDDQPNIKVEPEHWDLVHGRNKGNVAQTDGLNSIGLRGNSTNEMTLLHEIAHILHGRRGHNDHGPEYQRIMHSLLQEHLPEAAEMYADLLQLRYENRTTTASLRFSGDDDVCYEIAPYPGESEPLHRWSIGDLAELYADLGTGQIMNVWTHPDHRRQGLAHRLYDHASGQISLYHSPDEHCTPEGLAFKRSVGGPTIPDDQAYDPDQHRWT